MMHCVPGKYFNGKSNRCLPCKDGYYCPGFDDDGISDVTLPYNGDENKGIHVCNGTVSNDKASCDEGSSNSPIAYDLPVQQTHNTSAEFSIQHVQPVQPGTGSNDISCGVKYICNNDEDETKTETVSGGNFDLPSGDICTTPSGDKVFDYWEINGADAGTEYRCEGSNLSFTAHWRNRNSETVVCRPGSFLPRNGAECKSCPAGYACEGGGFPKNPSENRGIRKCDGNNEYSLAGVSECSQCDTGSYPNSGHTGCEFEPGGGTITVTVDEGKYLPTDSETPISCSQIEMESDEFCPGGRFTVVPGDHTYKGIYHCVAGGTHSTDYKTCKVQLSKDKLEHGILGEGECWLAETADEYKDCVFYGARDVKPNN